MATLNETYVATGMIIVEYSEVLLIKSNIIVNRISWYKVREFAHCCFM